MSSVLLHLEEVSSTNSWLSGAMERFSADGDGVVTFRQTQGRGQRGNGWESEPDANICMSLLFRPERFGAESFFLLSQMVSLGVCLVLEELLPGRAVAVKWPNDIYVDDLKVCGILIENRLRGSAIASSVVGIGLNVNQVRFVSDAPNPVSLCMLTGRKYDLMPLALRLQERVVGVYRTWRTEEVQRSYRDVLYRRDGWFPYRDALHGVFEARLVSVSPQGLLSLALRDGTVRQYAFKEVSFVL